MYSQDQELEQRLARLEAQLDRFSLTLHEWQQAQEQVAPIHASLSGELESRLSDTIAARLEHDVHQHTREILEAIERELRALQHLHDEPLKQLQALVAELRSGQHGPTGPTGSGTTWPLEDVLRVHDQLRRSEEHRERLPEAASGSTGDTPAALPSQTVQQLRAENASLTSRIETLERSVTHRIHQLDDSGNMEKDTQRGWSVAFAVLALVVIGILAVTLQRHIEARFNEAAARAAAAERQAQAATELADRRAVSAREEADHQIAEARQAAQRAQTISSVLAAPDLVRFVLSSAATTPPRSSAQLLWSRSRGLVFSASRVPAVAAGSTYQLWLITKGAPVSAALFEPNSAGQVTVVMADPPRVPRAVIDAIVTVEPGSGGHAPSGPTLLARAP